MPVVTAGGSDRTSSPSSDDLDRPSWERRWSRVLRAEPGGVVARPPSSHLTEALAGLAPGRALDAGCGHGAESVWLAERGWRVTGVDFSTAALAAARARARDRGEEIAARAEWIAADLATWVPPAGHFDLVASLYVHIADSVPAMVRRLASGVATGGTLFLVGHLPRDPATGAPSPAAGQLQISVEAAVSALGPDAWEIVTAERRVRATAGSGVDAVVCARRVG